jgi:leader peptidase (prepilin peptidase)/N-methyltransferase
LHDHPYRGQSLAVDVLIRLISGPLAWLPPLMVAPIIGSFLGVLILRLPAGRSVVIARSACDHCGHTLGLRDLIPLMSYAATRGRCRYCGAAIGRFNLDVELAALAVAAWVVTVVPVGQIWPACLLGWTLLALAWTDLRTMILPDVLTLPLLLAGLIVTDLGSPDALLDHSAAAALGWGLLFAVAWIYRTLRGRDGLGLGDAKLLGALGAWVGLGDLPVVLLMASCLGLAAAGIGAVAGKQMTAATAIPFGPCLALAGWLSWLYADLWNDWLIAHYMI